MDKLCRRCNETLPATAFHKSSREKTGLQQWCISCRKQWAVETDRNSYYRKYYHDNKETYLDTFYKSRYSISLLEYTALLETQKGVCAICYKPESIPHTNTKGETRRLAVDHDHTTGKVRGLLCSSCNQGIGALGDSVVLLENAIKYLTM